jgi:hypothetical protein
MEFEAEEMRVDDNLKVGEEMEDEEEVEVGGDKPKFVLVEFCQLEKLLQNQKGTDERWMVKRNCGRILGTKTKTRSRRAG